MNCGNTKWNDSTPTRQIVWDALYKNRETWLDPDDAKEMVNDIVNALGEMRRLRA